MIFVTVNCVPTTAGGLVQSIQDTGGVKLRVDCKVNPDALAGQERTQSFSLRLACNDTAEPRSATVYPTPAAIAVTPIKPAGTSVWPHSLYPHATTVPSVLKA